MNTNSNREQKVQQILTVLTNLSTNDIVNGILKQPDGPRRLREYMDFDARCGAVLRQKLKFSMIDLACQENTCFFVRELINTSESREEAIELCKQLNPPDPLVFAVDDNNQNNNNNNSNQNFSNQQHDPFAGPTTLLLHQQFLLQQQQQQQPQNFIHTNNLLNDETQNSQLRHQLVRHVFQTNEVGAQMELLKATRELIEFIISEVDPDVLAPLIFSKAVDLVNGNPEVRGPLILFMEKCTDQERMIRGILLEKVLSPHFPTLMCSYNGSRFLTRYIMIRKDIVAVATNNNNNHNNNGGGESQEQHMDNATASMNSQHQHHQHDGRSIWMLPLWQNNGIRDNFEAICRSRFSGCEFVLEFMKRVTLDFFDTEIVPFFVRDIMMASSENNTALSEEDIVPRGSAVVVGDENMKNFFIHDPQARTILEKVAATISETNRGGWLRKLIQALSTPSAFVNKAEKTVRALEDKFQRGEARKKAYINSKNINNASSQTQQKRQQHSQLNSEDFHASSSLQQFSTGSMTNQNNNININNNNSRSGSNANTNNNNNNNNGDLQHSTSFSNAGSPNSQSQLNTSFPTFSSSSTNNNNNNNNNFGNDPVLAKFEALLGEIFSNSSASPSSFVDKMTPSQVEDFYNSAVAAATSLQSRYVKMRTEEKRERAKAKQQQQLQQQNQQNTIPVAIARGGGSDYKPQSNINKIIGDTTPKCSASAFVLLCPSTSPTIKSARSDQLHDFVLGLLTSANAVAFGLLPKLLRNVFGGIHQRQPPPMWIPLAFASNNLNLLPKVISMMNSNNNSIAQNQIRHFCDSVLALFELTIANIQFHRHCYLAQQQMDGFLSSHHQTSKQQQHQRHNGATNSTQLNDITMFNSSRERCNFVEEIICTLFDSVLIPFDGVSNTNLQYNLSSRHHISPFFAHAASELLVNIAKLLISEKEKESQRLVLRRKQEQERERRGKQGRPNTNGSNGGEGDDDDDDENDELLQQDKSNSEVVALRVKCGGGSNNHNGNRLQESRMPTFLHIVNGVYWLLVVDWGFCRGKLRRILDDFVLFLGGAVHQSSSNNDFLLEQARQAAYFPFFVDQLFVPMIRTIPFNDPYNGHVIFPIAKSIFGVVFCRLHWDARRNIQASTSSTSASPFEQNSNALIDDCNDSMHSSFIQENFHDDEDDYFYQGSPNTINNTNNSLAVDDFFDQQKSTLRPGEVRDVKIVGFDFLKNPTGFHYLVKSKCDNNNNQTPFDINAAVVISNNNNNNNNKAPIRKQQTTSKKSNNNSFDARRFLSVPFEQNLLFLMNPVMLFNFIPKFLQIIPIEIVVDVAFTAMVPLLLVLRDEQRNGDNNNNANTSSRSEYKTLKHVLFSSLQKTEGRVNLFEHLAKYYGIDLENYEAPDFFASTTTTTTTTNDNQNNSNNIQLIQNRDDHGGPSLSLLSSSSSSTAACISFPPPLLFDAEFGFPRSYYPDSSPICIPPPMIVTSNVENTAFNATDVIGSSLPATPGSRRRPQQRDGIDDTEHYMINGSGQRRARE